MSVVGSAHGEHCISPFHIMRIFSFGCPQYLIRYVRILSIRYSGHCFVVMTSRSIPTRQTMYNTASLSDCGFGVENNACRLHILWIISSETLSLWKFHLSAFCKTLQTFCKCMRIWDQCLSNCLVNIKFDSVEFLASKL